MGNQTSVELPAPPEDNNYFAVAFRHPDRILLIYAPNSVRKVIRSAITATWTSGIYEEGVYYGFAYRFKLSDSPFMRHSGFEQAVEMKTMASAMLRMLYDVGWKLCTSSDLSRYHDLTTWFFTRIPKDDDVPSSTGDDATPSTFCCVSISSRNKLQLIEGTPELELAVENAIKYGYSIGGRLKRKESNVSEYSLEDAPWFSDGQTAIDARRFLGELIRQFEVFQFSFYGTANLKGTVDSLFFRYDSKLKPCNKFLVISLGRFDRLRVISAPEAVIKCVEEVCHQWPLGIQHIGNHFGAWECKLRGQPWMARDAEESVNGRMFMCQLFSVLHENGWSLHCSLDVARTLTDKSIFIMRNDIDESITDLRVGGQSYGCISFNKTNCVRLINLKQKIDKELGEIVQSRWMHGLESRTERKDFIEYILCGDPWETTLGGKDGLFSRAMLCVLFRILEKAGYRVVTSADISARYIASNHGPSYPVDVHSWFLGQTLDKAAFVHEENLGDI